MILRCWPRWIRPLIQSVSHEEIEFSFAGWQITDVESPFFKLPTVLERVLRPDEHRNRLRLYGLACCLTTGHCGRSVRPLNRSIRPCTQSLDLIRTPTVLYTIDALNQLVDRL